MIGQRLLICLLFMAALFPAAAGDEKSPPEVSSPGGWMEDINPADYALLAADLKDPFRFEGEINARPAALALRSPPAKGWRDRTSPFWS